MSNPLQPKIAKVLAEEYSAYIINVVMASKAGHMDIIACIPRVLHLAEALNRQQGLIGVFYGFEVKWKNDQPSELQKGKINNLIDAGGRGYFIRSVEQLRDILDNDRAPVKYEVKTRFKL
jgi:hypothetical protein